MIEKIKELLLSYEVEFSNDSTYSDRGIRKEDYNDLAQELVKLLHLKVCKECENNPPMEGTDTCQWCALSDQ